MRRPGNQAPGYKPTMLISWEYSGCNGRVCVEELGRTRRQGRWLQEVERKKEITRDCDGREGG